jgi:hypothetical protein
MISKHEQYWLTRLKVAQALSELYPELPPPVVIVRPASGPKRSSRLKPFWPKAKEAAFEWLTVNGCQEKGDGGQARLEAYVVDWLDARGYSAGESTVREHVRAWIAGFKAAL